MPKIIVVGHRVASPMVMKLPEKPIYAKQALQLYNYTRVYDEKSNTLIDHDEFFKINNNIEGRFSVWEMYLASGLILSSHLKRNDFEVKLFNTIDSSNESDFIKEANEFDADIIIFSTSGIILTSLTEIPHLEFNQLEIKETFLSCVLPDNISLPIIKIAAFTFLIFFFIEVMDIYEI